MPAFDCQPYSTHTCKSWHSSYQSHPSSIVPRHLADVGRSAGPACTPVCTIHRPAFNPTVLTTGCPGAACTSHQLQQCHKIMLLPILLSACTHVRTVHTEDQLRSIAQGLCNFNGKQLQAVAHLLTEEHLKQIRIGMDIPPTNQVQRQQQQQQY